MWYTHDGYLYKCSSYIAEHSNYSICRVTILQAIIISVILTKGLVIAKDQCTEYQFRSYGESCEDVYNRYPESHNCSGYYRIAHRVFCGMSYTGSSCEDIFKKYIKIYQPQDTIIIQVTRRGPIAT